MKTRNEMGLSSIVNDFIERIKKHGDLVSIIKDGNETIIAYEDWSEHPPIRNARKKEARVARV